MTESPQHLELLVALLALQHDWITAEQLIELVGQHQADLSPLGELLQSHRLLTAEEYRALRSMADMYMSRHGNNSVAAMTAIGSSEIPWQKLIPLVSGELSQVIKSVVSEKWDRTIDYDSLPTVGNLATSTSPDSPRIGNRFRVLRFHRKGGLGFVSIAEDQELHRRVAVKQIREDQADQADQQAKFLLEAEITGGLEHPNIVPVYGLGRDMNGHPYYAMKFIQGDSLKDAIRSFHRITRTKSNAGRIQVRLRQLLQHFIDVCHAMQYAHNRGVLHRDLKPSNIMLGRYGETLVVDWGLARTRASEPEAELHGNEEPPLDPPSAAETSPDPAGVAIGTPRYMAPEQATGQVEKFGRWTDVYSLGATLYTLLTDRIPFPGSDVSEILRNVRDGKFAPPRMLVPEVPAALEAICLKAMAMRPAQRYQTAQELADDLERWLADEPVTAWNEPLKVRIGRWVRKHQTLVTSTVATLTVALGISLFAAVLLNNAWQRAEANFQVAKRAVDQYFTDVSENVLLNQAGMQPLRRNLLAHARLFYEDFLQSRGGDRSIRVDAARTHFRLGRIHEATNRFPEAITSYQQAIMQQQAIAEELPTSTERLADLALTWNAIGRTYNEMTDIQRAEPAYQTALQLRQRIVTLAPTNIEYRRWLANSMMNLGEFALSHGKLTVAEPLLRDSQQLRQQTLAEFPAETSDELQLDLAKGFYNLGRLAFTRTSTQVATPNNTAGVADTEQPEAGQNDQADVARSQFQLGVEHCQQLLNKNPDKLESIELLVNCQRMLADSYMRLGNERQAATLYRETLPVLRRLTYGNPDEVRYAFRLAGVCINLASAMEHRTVTPQIGSYESASYYWEYAEELLVPLQSRLANDPEYQRDLAIVICHRAFEIGKHDQTAGVNAAERASRLFAALDEAGDLDHEGRRIWIAALHLIGRDAAIHEASDKAMESFRTALRLQREQRAQSTDQQQTITLAKLLLDLARQQLRSGASNEARDGLQEADRLLGEQVDVTGGTPELLTTHADILKELGTNHTQLGLEPLAARQHLLAAEGLLIQITEKYPMNAKLASELELVREALKQFPGPLQ